MNKKQVEKCNCCGKAKNAFFRPTNFAEKRIAEKAELMKKKTIALGYRFVGKHSAIKICQWTKEAIRGKNACYKNTFYGIKSNQCIQMTPTMFYCNFNCLHCWRNFDFFLPRKNTEWDKPKDILNGCEEEQKKLLMGFFGNNSIEKKGLEEAMKPKHVAISLSGEPTLYPLLPELIEEIKERKMTAFLVSNGTNPKMLEKLKKTKSQPTNLYISVYGTSKEMYKKTCAPMTKDYWEKTNESLGMLKEFDCNTVIRLTLTKELNLENPAGYAKIIEKAQPDFVEVKAFMSVGGARKILPYERMPSHQEIREFAEKIREKTNYKITAEKTDSRVVLLEKKE